MTLSEKDKDLLVAILLLFLGAYVCGASLDMPSRGSFAESPGIFPFLMGVLLIILSAVYAIRSVRQGGAIKFGQMGTIITSLFSEPEKKNIMLAIGFVLLYIIGVGTIGYYISSAIFMAAMFLIYVKRYQTWVSLSLALGLASLLFLTFNVLFMLPIK